MKSYTRRTMAVTSLVAMTIGTASVLNAQTLESTANVPFAFTAGTTSLPRGTYHLATLPGHTDALMIRGLQHGVIMLSQPAGSSRTDNTPRLVFERYAGSVLPPGDPASWQGRLRVSQDGRRESRRQTPGEWCET